ncbi:hypothetical protein A9Q86_12235 [Flavobacteriales bacterium 33_180_T64]|nr:hypothetical protein A9Q86_12235 [Flavobacteriales bacterium 33_180_T64]
MNIPANLAKSCLLATVIFWVIISSKSIDPDIILFMFLSIIPIFIVSTIVILSTICSVFWLAENADFNKKQVFKTYYPYYVIIVFGICVFAIISSGFDLYIIAFFSSVFITTNQSWVWFAKETQK